MPDVGTPQAPWRDDEDWAGFVRTFDDANMRFDLDEASGLAAAADRRAWAATLRAKIEAMPLPFDNSSNHILTVYRRSVLAVLDAVLGGAE